MQKFLFIFILFAFFVPFFTFAQWGISIDPCTGSTTPPEIDGQVNGSNVMWCTGTSTNLTGNITSAFFQGIFNLWNTVLPYAIGLLILFIGYLLARRALGGR